MKKDHEPKLLSRKAIDRYERKLAKKLKKSGAEDIDHMSLSINQLERMAGKEGRRTVYGDDIALMRGNSSVSEADMQDYIRALPATIERSEYPDLDKDLVVLTQQEEEVLEQNWADEEEDIVEEDEEAEPFKRKPWMIGDDGEEEDEEVVEYADQNVEEVAPTATNAKRGRGRPPGQKNTREVKMNLEIDVSTPCFIAIHRFCGEPLVGKGEPSNGRDYLLSIKKIRIRLQQCHMVFVKAAEQKITRGDYMVWANHPATRATVPTHTHMKKYNTTSLLSCLAHAAREITLFTMGTDGISCNPDFWRDLASLCKDLDRVTLVLCIDDSEMLQLTTTPYCSNDKTFATFSVKTLIEGMDGNQVDEHHQELLNIWQKQQGERVKLGEQARKTAKVRTKGRSKVPKERFSYSYFISLSCVSWLASLFLLFPRFLSIALFS